MTRKSRLSTNLIPILFQGGLRKHYPLFRAHILKGTGDGVCVVVPNHIGSAVKRNRTKRRLLSALSQYVRNSTKETAIVVVANKNVLYSKFDELVASCLQLDKTLKSL